MRSAEPHPGRCSVCPPCSGPRAAGGSASGLFPALRPVICYQAVNGGLCEPVLHSLPQGLRPLVIQYILESTLIPYRTLCKTSLASNCLSFQQWGCFFSEKVVLVNINILYFGWVSIFPSSFHPQCWSQLKTYLTICGYLRSLPSFIFSTLLPTLSDSSLSWPALALAGSYSFACCFLNLTP